MAAAAPSEALEAPRLLYKYYPPGRRSFLADLLVSFSTLEQFNDPLEGLTPSDSLFPQEGPGSLADRAARMDLRKEAYMRTYRMAVQRGATIEQANSLARQVSDNDAIIAVAAQAIPRLAQQALASSGLNYLAFEAEMAKGIGILSVTVDVLSPPMWAHYAAGYTGFAVEFDASHPFFHRSPFATVQPVSYAIRRLDHALQMDATDILLRKASSWEYEQEWRTFRLTDQADVITASGHHLFHVPVEAVTGIVVGERCATDLEAEVIRQSRLRRWSVSRVVADRRNKVLNIIKVGKYGRNN